MFPPHNVLLVFQRVAFIVFFVLHFSSEWCEMVQLYGADVFVDCDLSLVQTFFHSNDRENHCVLSSQKNKSQHGGR